MRVLPLLVLAFIVGCGGSEPDDDAEEPSSSSGGSCESSSGAGPSTATTIFECSREGGSEWSVIYLSVSQSKDESCARLELRRTGAAEDTGLSIDLPDGAVLASARGGQAAICDQPPDSWPAASQGSGSITLVGSATDPTEADVDVVMTFDPASQVCPIIFDYKAGLVCND